MADIEGRSKELKIVDIGDSSGNHLQYIKGLWPEKQIRTLSVNLDSRAVEQIRQKGLEAICCRAEDIKRYSANADVFLSFEMLEHLTNPIQFMHDLSENTNCKFFVITVPYVRHSRLGLGHLRHNYKTELNAADVHIFELSPQDWKLLFQFAGWRAVFEETYLQYPRRHWSRITKPYWQRFDFEGFYGVILVRDDTWRNLYKDWQ